MEHLFHVQGMTCGHCEIAVKRAILKLDTQAKVAIDRSENKVQVDSAKSRESLAQVIADEGYTVAA